jgi:hypothetical protein
MLSVLAALTKYNDCFRIRANVLPTSFSEKSAFKYVYSVKKFTLDLFVYLAYVKIAACYRSLKINTGGQA